MVEFIKFTYDPLSSNTTQLKNFYFESGAQKQFFNVLFFNPRLSSIFTVIKLAFRKIVPSHNYYYLWTSA